MYAFIPFIDLPAIGKLDKLMSYPTSVSVWPSSSFSFCLSSSSASKTLKFKESNHYWMNSQVQIILKVPNISNSKMKWKVDKEW